MGTTVQLQPRVRYGAYPDGSVTVLSPSRHPAFRTRRTLLTHARILQTLGTVVEDAPVAPKGFEEVDDDVTDDSDDDDSDTDSDSDDNDDDDDGGNTHAFRYGALSFRGCGPAMLFFVWDAARVFWRSCYHPAY